MKKPLVLTLTSAFVLSLALGAAANPLRNKIDKVTGADKCASNDQACQNRAKLKEAAGAAVIGLAAKLIYDMVIEAKSEQVDDEPVVVDEYKRQNKTLPPNPVARDYVVNAFPGNVVKPVNDVKIRSQVTVVPGAARKEMLVEERITIYDNEDHKKPLRVTTKIVNEHTKRGGRFKNEFGFSFPEGVPQGMYPISTELLLDGKAVETKQTDMQLVMVVEHNGALRLASLPRVPSHSALN